jgi:membrane protease YdiL (CAAX protease family)
MNSADRDIAPWRRNLRDNFALIALEFALIAAVFVADEYHYIFFSKTPYLLALAWLSLALRGVRWRDVGLALPANWLRLLLIGIGAGVAMELLELFVTQPLLVALTGKFPDLSEFRELRGNIGLLVVLIAAAWIVAALGEELVWRGYVLNRCTDLFGRGRVGWILSIALCSIAFGLAHSYQDVTGIVENSLDGALLALLYVASGRQLIAPIVAHGITDSVDFLIIFSGHYPGMQ